MVVLQNGLEEAANLSIVVSHYPVMFQGPKMLRRKTGRIARYYGKGDTNLPNLYGLFLYGRF